MSTQKSYWARRPFDYSDDVGYDRGEFIGPLGGLTNDEALIRLQYVGEFKSKAANPRLFPCRECGKKFIEEALREMHGRTRHRARTLSPEQAERAEDKEERMLEQVAPLNLERTKASMGA